MSSHRSIDVKEIVFVGEGAQKAFAALPADVLKPVNAVLSRLQNGKRVEGNKFKDLTGNKKLEGISEIRIEGDDGNTYRVYEILIFKEVIYILDAGAKKSMKGSSIPQVDIERLGKRKDFAERDYKANKEEYSKRYDVRLSNRTRFAESSIQFRRGK